MGFFDFLKPKQNTTRFITETVFQEKRDKQLQMTPQLIEELRKLGVKAENELKLEYFFYTNTAEKAKNLATEIEKLGYEGEHGVSASSVQLFVITGWTTKIQMSDATLLDWTREMCELGFKFDAVFDGWGTYPNQD